MGGVGFSFSMAWAQIFPFVALHFFEGDEFLKNAITYFLICSFTSWLLLNVVFFCTIDLRYLNTFFSWTTAPQYTCMLYNTSEEDYQKFDAVFGNRIQYTSSIHDDVKTWVAANIDLWKLEKEEW